MICISKKSFVMILSKKLAKISLYYINSAMCIGKLNPSLTSSMKWCSNMKTLSSSYMLHLRDLFVYSCVLYCYANKNATTELLNTWQFGHGIDAKLNEVLTNEWLKQTWLTFSFFKHKGMQVTWMHKIMIRSKDIDRDTTKFLTHCLLLT